MKKRQYVKKDMSFWGCKTLGVSSNSELTASQIKMIAVVSRALNNRKTMSRAETEARALLDVVSLVK